jgi:hypothetical protein
MRLRWFGGFVATWVCVAVAASPPTSNLIVGSWASGATGERNLVLDVTPTEVTFGRCTSPYAVVRLERSAHRPSVNTYRGTWTYIAIQLRPDRSKDNCRDQPEVLEFAIPDDRPCHSELLRYQTMEDFWQSFAYMESLSWGNVDCLMDQAPITSLEGAPRHMRSAQGRRAVQGSCCSLKELAVIRTEHRAPIRQVMRIS